MEEIIFVGIQASGKSTFYKEKFFNSHLRISNDLFRQAGLIPRPLGRFLILPHCWMTLVLNPRYNPYLSETTTSPLAVGWLIKDGK
jgi:hypothetical protein